jgi:hypothetical protein
MIVVYMKEIDPVELALEVSAELDQVYGFRKSKAGIYVFDPGNPATKLIEIMEKSGMLENGVAEKLNYYRSGEIGGSCVYTDGEFGCDYLVLIPSLTAPKGEFSLIISEETMHGEHFVRHKNSGKYINMFSGIIREFFGGSGRYQIADKVCEIPEGMTLKDIFSRPKPEYDEKKDEFAFDINHVIGYELAREASCNEPEWKRAMFHEPDERRIWGLYNDVIIPGIKISTPPALDNKDDLLKEVEKYIQPLGLKCNVSLVIDESDTRGKSKLQSP